MPTPPPSSGGPSGIGMGGASQIGVGAASGGATPFQVGGNVPTQGTAEESRMQSARVFAIILAAMAMVFLAVLGAVGILWWKWSEDQKAPEVAVAAPMVTPKAEAPEVEETYEAPPPPKPVAKKSSGGGGGGSPPPSRPSATGTVNITFTGSPIPSSVEIDCGSAFREKKTLSGGSAIFSGVPTSGDCKAIPKGGVVGSKAPVRGGGSYTCSIQGTTTVCK